MTKRRKNVKPKKPHPEQDHFLMRIKKGERLYQIVQNVIGKTNTDSDEFEELDLSEFSSIDKQIEFLKGQDRVDSMYIT